MSTTCIRRTRRGFAYKQTRLLIPCFYVSCGAFRTRPDLQPRNDWTIAQGFNTGPNVHRQSCVFRDNIREILCYNNSGRNKKPRGAVFTSSQRRAISTTHRLINIDCNSIAYSRPWVTIKKRHDDRMTDLKLLCGCIYCILTPRLRFAADFLWNNHNDARRIPFEASVGS
jgi:hypothetical protein